MREISDPNHYITFGNFIQYLDSLYMMTDASIIRKNAFMSQLYSVSSKKKYGRYKKECMFTLQIIVMLCEVVLEKYPSPISITMDGKMHNFMAMGIHGTLQERSTKFTEKF
jgi:hypothetical protein